MLLKEIATVKGGKRLPKSDSLVSEKTDHPYIRIRDMYQSYPLELNDDFEYITSETHEKIKKYTVEQGDVIIAVVGNTIGLVSVIGESLHGANLTENCNKIVDIHNYESRFLYYFLTSAIGQNEIKKGIIGSSQPKLPIYNIEKFQLPDFPLEEQARVVEVLETIDKKISNNEKINENLLQQAQALYNHSFPYTVSDILPEGWRLGTVSEIIEIHDSKRIPLSGAQRDNMEKKIYPYYGAASLMDYVDEYIFNGKYLLLGEDGTVVDDAGFPILQYVWGQFWVNNHAHILTGKLGYNVESLYMLFKQTPVKSIVTGAVQPKISQANLKSIPVVIPPANLIRAFNNQVNEIFALIRNIEEENKSLATLRDSLLPKLMSGEMDLSALDL